MIDSFIFFLGLYLFIGGVVGTLAVFCMEDPEDVLRKTEADLTVSDQELLETKEVLNKIDFELFKVSIFLICLFLWVPIAAWVLIVGSGPPIRG